MDDVYEIVRDGQIYFKVRGVSSREEAEGYVDELSTQVGTLMVDLSDWRFKSRENECLALDTDQIVEIYAEAD